MKLAPLFAVAYALAGCAPDGVQDVAPFEVYDSAGVEIVINRDSAWGGAARWALSEHPILSIGCRDCGDPMQALGLIAGVARMPNGSIAVLDFLAKTVLTFDSAGQFVRAIGRPGAGPGEFNQPDRMGLLNGGLIAVHDAGSYIQQVFSSEGILVRSVADPHIPDWGGRLFSVPLLWRDDGSFFIQRYPQSSDLPQVRGTASAELRLVDPTGESVTQVGMFPVAHGEAQPSAGGYQVGGQTVFGARGSFGTDGQGLWHGYPESYEFRYYDSSGVVRKIVRREWDPVRVPAAVREAYQVSRLERAREEARRLTSAGRERLEAEMEAMSFADFFPAYLRIRVGSDGTIWVREYPAPDEIDFENSTRHGFAGKPNWTVFSPEGHWLGTVALPNGFTIHEIHPDLVLGVWRDDLDVQYVRAYQVIRD